MLPPPEQRKIFLFGFDTYGRTLYKHLKNDSRKVDVVVRKGSAASDTPSKSADTMHATTFTKSDLQKLGIDPLQDMVFCAFDDVTDTLFAILSLRALFPEISIIALSDSRENSRKLRYAGAERVIDLYEEAANQMLCRLTRPALNRAIDDILYRQGGVKMVEIEIPEQSPCDGKHLREIDFKSRGLILLAIVDQSKKSKLLITDRSIDQRVYAGELLIIIGKEEDLQRFRERLSPAAHPMGMPV